MPTLLGDDKFESKLSALKAPSAASSRKSVLSWVENLPPPEIDIESTSSAITSTKKRKKASLTPILNDRVLRPCRQGPAAKEIDAKQSLKKQGAGRQRGRPLESRGLAGKEKANKDEHEHTEEDIEDVDATPRPARGRKVAWKSSSLQPSSEDSSSRSTRSPMKMSRLRGLKTPHSYELLHNVFVVDAMHPLYKIEALLKDLERISEGTAVVPEALKVLSTLSPALHYASANLPTLVSTRGSKDRGRIRI
ncbi:MAG: hypothetical protein Q9191_000533 [Dirinaria sp. TL-2023a]